MLPTNFIIDLLCCVINVLLATRYVSELFTYFTCMQQTQMSGVEPLFGNKMWSQNQSIGDDEVSLSSSLSGAGELFVEVEHELHWAWDSHSWVRSQALRQAKEWQCKKLWCVNEWQMWWYFACYVPSGPYSVIIYQKNKKTKEKVNDRKCEKHSARNV